MLDQITKSVLEHWEQLWPSTSPPRDLRCVLQSRRRVILFLFDARRKGSKLVGVVKICRHADENHRLERSVRLTNTVREHLDGHVLETVPKMILLGPICGLSASLEQGLPGDPMGFGPFPWAITAQHRRNWQAWREWLLEFQRQTACGSVTIDAQMIDQIVIPKLVQALEHDPASSHVISELQTVTRELDGLVIGKVWRYGDAHHSNILNCGRRISGVIDWEGIEADQWPTQDWFQFAFQYLVDLFRIKMPEVPDNELGKKAIETLLQSADSPLGSMIQQQTETFLATLGAKTSVLSPFLVVFLADLYWPWNKADLLKHAWSLLCG